MTQTITLGQIRLPIRSKDRWWLLIEALGTSDPETVVSIGDVALTCGVNEAIWCLGFLDDPRVRVRAIMPTVKRTSAYTTDPSDRDRLAAIERWLEGDDSADLLAAWQAPVHEGPPDPAKDAAEAIYAAAMAASVGNPAQSVYAAEIAVEAAAEAAWAAAPRAPVVAESGGYDAERARQRDDLYDAERERQRADLIAMFPPMALAGRAAR